MLTAVVDDERLDAHAIALATALVRYADREGTCWPHQTTLAAKLGMSVRNVQRALVRLRSAGYIRSRQTDRGLVYGLQIAPDGPAAGVVPIASRPVRLSRADTTRASRPIKGREEPIQVNVSPPPPKPEKEQRPIATVQPFPVVVAALKNQGVPEIFTWRLATKPFPAEQIRRFADELRAEIRRGVPIRSFGSVLCHRLEAAGPEPEPPAREPEQLRLRVDPEPEPDRQLGFAMLEKLRTTQPWNRHTEGAAHG